MKVGFLGSGKLGGPVALAMESKGHEVLVCDRAEWVCRAFEEKVWPHREDRVPELIAKTNIRCVGISQLVRECDVIFVAVQTPHEPRFGGAVPMPFDDRQDFDYSTLSTACYQLGGEMFKQGRWPLVSVISTVLPGTMRREVYGAFHGAPAPEFQFAYTPFFAAMGTVVKDVLDPEFVLVGTRDGTTPAALVEVFRQMHDKPILTMSVESAELAKVAYNLAISTKIAMVNTIMEVCHHVPGCDADDVTSVLKHATDRIVSPKYLDCGMGDGGGCHPRDGIAMSWLARKLGLSCNFFETVMQAREAQASWLVDMLCKVGEGRPVVIFGKSYKPESNLTDGSPALLCGEFLRRKKVAFHQYDPLVDGGTPDRYLDHASAYLIGTKHQCFASYRFPRGSVVLDPFRVVPDQPGVRVVRVGEGKTDEV